MNAFRFSALMLFFAVGASFAAETIGFVWPKKDLLIPDTSKGDFKLLRGGNTYPLLKEIDAGYVVLWETIEGSPRLALIPFRDNMGNLTASPYGPPVTLRSVDVKARPAFIPLTAGERYPVVARSNGNCSVAFTYGALTQIVLVAETNCSYVSAGDYTSVLSKLISSAASQISTGASSADVAATFTNYRGQFADETSKEREELAKQYTEQVALAEKHNFEAEQTAKGLVEFRGEWITPAEKQKRLEQGARLEEEAQKRAAEEWARQRASKEATVREKPCDTLTIVFLKTQAGAALSCASSATLTLAASDTISAPSRKLCFWINLVTGPLIGLSVTNSLSVPDLAATLSLRTLRVFARVWNCGHCVTLRRERRAPVTVPIIWSARVEGIADR
ncbi:MAG: hypothetical protein HY646_14240 [Acidobacteria bacterium]|nr:hypothetical protein [Acidobacteriota bacterium]